MAEKKSTKEAAEEAGKTKKTVKKLLVKKVVKSPVRRSADEVEKVEKVKKSTVEKIAKKTVKKVVKKTKVSSATKEKSPSQQPAKEAEEVTEKAKVDNRPAKYYEGVGRRKKAVARVRLFTRGDKDFSVNSKPYIEYFPTKELQQLADGALTKMKVTDKFSVSVLVRGGGIAGQAEAVRHGTARALLKFNADFRKRLKRAGFLTRDPRKKERRKFGLKKARKAPQWAKR